MNRSILICASTLLLLVCANDLKADLISNGSFENATGGLPDDWNPTGNMRVINTQGMTDGNWALAFSWNNQPSNGVISQTFATTLGTVYDLRFDFGKYSVNNAPSARLDVDVFDGAGVVGATLRHETVEDATFVSSSTIPADVYDSFHYQFTANSDFSTLRFADVSDAQAGGGGFDAMLDKVSVSAVPEPSSLAILGFVTAMIGAGRYRRRSALSDNAA